MRRRDLASTITLNIMAPQRVNFSNLRLNEAQERMRQIFEKRRFEPWFTNSHGETVYPTELGHAVHELAQARGVHVSEARFYSELNEMPRVGFIHQDDGTIILRASL